MSTAERLGRFAGMPVAADVDPDILPLPQRELWGDLGNVPFDFVLYGGTALALRRGHRQSVDFDFFSSVAFAPGDLLASLSWLGRVEIVDSKNNTLTVLTPSEVKLSFFGGMNLQVVAEPSLAPDNGLVVASVFDLAGTKAKALLDRSEWKDYLDIDELLGSDLTLPDMIGCATTIFEPSFVFPAALFLKCLVSFEDGTAPDVPAEVRARLEAAARDAWRSQIPVVEPFASRITPRGAWVGG